MSLQSNKLILIIVFIILTIFSVTAYIFSQTKSSSTKIIPTPTPTLGPTINPSITQQLGDTTTKEECVQKGGVWSRWGLSPKEYCQIPSKDAGKPCTDGSQCSYNLCLSREETRPGVCAKFSGEFGCYYTWRNGKKDQGFLCVD